jgi:hypothetical protein
MEIVRRCPGCGSPNIRGSILLKDSQYIQIIYCDDCSYSNNREIGSAEEIIIPEEVDDE